MHFGSCVRVISDHPAPNGDKHYNIIFVDVYFPGISRLAILAIKCRYKQRHVLKLL